MSTINLLGQDTIDKIAAGEVIERPASIVKELVENAIDAHADAVTIEIRGGGIELIRITDNGEGIEPEQIPKAFLRHATSKISSADDLLTVRSLGFRGEALSSISAVSQVELITKRPGALIGSRYRIEGGREIGLEEIGAPEGSTFLVRNVFYNTPARKKFLKSAVTEANTICDLTEHIALSHPDISFKVIVNGQTKMHTSGNHNLADMIYSIYGRETAAALIRTEAEADGMRITGYIGNPSLSRGNRGFENYFVNGRYIRSNLITKAIEEGYAGFLMQHRYPFTVLYLEMDGSLVDVNVHPAKREVRFSEQEKIFDLFSRAVREALTGKEMIPEVSPAAQKELLQEQKEEKKQQTETFSHAPEPFEQIRRSFFSRHDSPYEPKYPSHSYPGSILPSGTAFRENPAGCKTEKTAETSGTQEIRNREMQDTGVPEKTDGRQKQMELFDDRLLSRQNVPEHRIIGQIFDTFWLVEFRDHLYMIDQHAAHEKVIYEQLCARMEAKQATSQMVSPPLIVTLTSGEESLLSDYMDYFRRIGFEIEQFGGKEYAISAVPDNLYGFSDALLFTQMLDTLSENQGHPSETFLYEKLAGMACKAAVKGKNHLSFQEASALITQLLSLEDPYHCPHGRPTIISMSRYEIEKKFKRIV